MFSFSEQVRHAKHRRHGHGGGDEEAALNSAPNSRPSAGERNMCSMRLVIRNPPKMLIDEMTREEKIVMFDVDIEQKVTW